MSNPSIQDIVFHHFEAHVDAPPEQLVAQLVAREEAMADYIRMAGQQYGLFPQIVAEVLAEIEMGEPIPAEQRQMVLVQYQALMEQVAAAHRGEGPMPTP